MGFVILVLTIIWLMMPDNNCYTRGGVQSVPPAKSPPPPPPPRQI
jgi:hypothetical protein